MCDIAIGIDVSSSLVEVLKGREWGCAALGPHSPQILILEVSLLPSPVEGSS